MAAENVPDWFHDSVISGVQLLHVLSLPGTPAAETVALTATVWIRALYSTPVNWSQEHDAPRLEAAFVELARTAERWPGPREVLARMPRRVSPPVPQLPEPIATAEEVAARRARLRQVMEELTERMTQKVKQ